MEHGNFTAAGSDCPLLAGAGLTLDRITHEARRDGRMLRLELKEFQLLEYLLRNKNRIISREEIGREIWGREVLDHTLDSRMSALRKKVEHDFPDKLLYTISRKGYLLVDPTATDERGQQ